MCDVCIMCKNDMAFKIIHLEDSAMKHSAISRAIKSVVSAEIDWVTDVSGLMRLTIGKEN